MTREKPKYQPGQVVEILHSWAKNIPPQKIVDVIFDEPWNCYAYELANSLILIEEHKLAPTDENGEA